MALTRPEIETGIALTELELMHCRDELLSLTTSIDLLEVYFQAKPNVVWKRDLNHDSLIEHIKVSPSLRQLLPIAHNLVVALAE